MIWGYLVEFWEAITSVGEYTIEFFQNIGKAVAGALGNLFEFIIHHITDVFVFGAWIFESLNTFLANLFTPIRYVYSFLKAFVDEAFLTSTFDASEVWEFPANIMEVFNSIPYFDIFRTALGVGVLIVIGVATFRKFMRL